MGKKGGKTKLNTTVVEPTPVAPASPSSKGTAEVAAAGTEEKERRRASYGSEKTLLSRGATRVKDEDTLG